MRRAVWLVVQILGFVAGLALLTWCVSLALSEQNREQLALLLDASPWRFVSLLVLTAATVVLNGLIFHATLVPVRRLRASDVVAVSALATFLNYLPLKISALTRVLIHNRRDGVPLMTIGAWFVAVGIVILIVLGPLGAASAWRAHGRRAAPAEPDDPGFAAEAMGEMAAEGLDLSWWITGVGGMIVVGVLTVLIARRFAGRTGRARLHRFFAALRLRIVRRFMRTAVFAEVHRGLDMLASGRMVAITVAMRIADVAVQTARFHIAAQMLGHDISVGQAVLFATTYFFVGAASPFGMLGPREGSIVAIAAAAGIAEPRGFAAVPLLVTAAESVVTIAGATIGLAWLRPDKLIRGRMGERIRNGPPTA